jgi:hypothetical protein
VAQLKNHLPNAYHELERIRQTPGSIMTSRTSSSQSNEVVYMLQTRNGKRGYGGAGSLWTRSGS